MEVKDAIRIMEIGEEMCKGVLTEATQRIALAKVEIELFERQLSELGRFEFLSRLKLNSKISNLSAAITKDMEYAEFSKNCLKHMAEHDWFEALSELKWFMAVMRKKIYVNEYGIWLEPDWCKQAKDLYDVLSLLHTGYIKLY